MAFINIGFGNIINTDKVVSIVTPDSVAKRLVQRAKKMATSLMQRKDVAPEVLLSQISISYFLHYCRIRLPQDQKRSSNKKGGG